MCCQGSKLRRSALLNYNLSSAEINRFRTDWRRHDRRIRFRKMILEARPEARVFSAACPLLVPLTEEGWAKKPLTRMIVKKYLHPLKVRRIDTLILGNPHYTLLSTVIQTKIGRRVQIVDSAAGVSARLRRFLAVHPDLDRTLPKSGRTRLVFTDLTLQVEKAVEYILKQSLPLESSTDIRQLPPT